MKIGVGTSYYPENWNRERIIRDADLMKKAGLSFVRMGEFAWSHFEPADGEYHFEWLEEAVQIFGERGINSVLCTPSSAAPVWMCRKYPSILRQGRNGERPYFGHRDHTCYSSVKYRELVAAVTEKLAEHFQNNPYVAAWQIDNEPGASRFSQCFCPDCQKKFRQYLKEKYRSLEALNNAWRTPFWSGEFFEWDDVELSDLFDRTMSSKTLESRRFRSREQADFVLFQAEIIRRKMPGVPIGTNNYGIADRYEVFSKLDFAANDCYPNYRPEGAMMDPVRHKMLCALYSGLKPGVSPWILETPPNPAFPMKDLTKFFFWLYAGFGYDRIFYFPWGNAPAGDEKIHLSVVDAFGKPGYQYSEMCKMISEADDVLKEFSFLPLPRSQYAVLRDHDAEWMFSGSDSKRMEQYYKGFYCSYSSLCKTGDFAEIISKTADWSTYKLLVVPVQNNISKALADKLRLFVESGGVVVMNGSSGCFDEYGNYADSTAPEHVSELFGIEIGENRPCTSSLEPVFDDTPEFYRNRPVVKGSLNGKNVTGTFSLWTGYIYPTTAETVMTFANSQLEGHPFCTVNRFGKGFAIYYAADRIDQHLCDEIIRFAAEKAGLTPVSYPENISVIRRGTAVFLYNFGDAETEFSIELKGRNLIGNALQNGKIVLPPFDFALIARDKNGNSFL